MPDSEEASDPFQRNPRPQTATFPKRLKLLSTKLSSSENTKRPTDEKSEKSENIPRPPSIPKRVLNKNIVLPVSSSHSWEQSKNKIKLKSEKVLPHFESKTIQGSPWEAYKKLLDIFHTRPVALAQSKSKLKSLVAVRKIEPTSKQNTERLASLKVLNHKNINKILDVFCDAESLYVISEFLSFSLAQICDLTIDLQEGHVKQISKDIIEAIIYLTAVRLFHELLDLDSVFIASTGHVVVSRIEDCLPIASDESFSIHSLGMLLIDLINHGKSKDLTLSHVQSSDLKSENNIYIKEVSKWSLQLIEFIDNLINSTERPDRGYFQQFAFLQGESPDLKDFITLASIQCSTSWMPVS